MCTRINHITKHHGVYTGRTLDWCESVRNDIWILPDGMEKEGRCGVNTLSWTSLYRSVVISAYDLTVSDGMNQKGLVVNMLWAAGAHFPTPAQSDLGRKPISVSLWAQYLLDMCDSVENAIFAMQQIVVQSATLPSSGKKLLCHLSVADAKGKVAIFEYIKGQLHISANVIPPYEIPNYHYYINRDICAMTNQPDFEKQVSINHYWRYTNKYKSIHGNQINLPGTSSSLDRFIRASYYTNQLPQQVDRHLAVAGVTSVLRNVCRPWEKLAASLQKQTEQSQTWYLSIADQQNRVLYYQATLSPYLIWLDLNHIQLPNDAGEQKKGIRLALDHDGVARSGNTQISGDISAILNYSPPETLFTYLASDAALQPAGLNRETRAKETITH